MFKPGDVVTVDFPGVTGIKRRPAVVVSTGDYHRNRPDFILGVITSQFPTSLHPSDSAIQDWAEAGLNKPSVFRTFLMTLPSSGVKSIGQLSVRDWLSVQKCLRASIAV